MAVEWIEHEFSGLKLGDKRREKRARILLEQMARMADSSPDACRGKAALAALYRFAQNPQIQPETILQRHNQASIDRTKPFACVVLAQDTTVVDLTKPQTQVEGAGPLETDQKRGFFFHPLYAVSESGIALGMVDQVVWTRKSIRTDLSTQEKTQHRKQKAIEEKESFRWLEMLQSGEQIARANPGTHYVNVADSECDVCELDAEATEFPQNYDLVVRACQNRALADDGATTIDDALKHAPVQFSTRVSVSERVSEIVGETRPRRKSRAARTAEIQVRASQVTLRGAWRPGGRLPDVVVNVVEAVEIDPPTGEDPIRWVLITTLPIDSVEQIRRVIAFYVLRWTIELFFKTLKSGMNIEKLKYEKLDRYLTAASLLIIVAWRVEYLKSAARHDPDASCEKYFSADEWIPCYLVVHKTQEYPAVPPTTAAFLLLVAQLGGYLSKKGQGPPGSTTLWRGLRRLEAYAEAFQAFGKQNLRCVE